MTNKNKIAIGVLGLLVLFAGARLWGSFRSPPQLPATDEAFQTVDALFTAVTAHDVNRLAACEERLSKLHDAGQLPAAAWKRLKATADTARSGDWDSAARRLYDFMAGQRRDSSRAT